MPQLKRPIQPMPDFVARALIEEGLRDQYDARPAYQRNDYLWWINSAKREETRQKRLSTMLAELRAGHGYMDMDWMPR